MFDWIFFWRKKEEKPNPERLTIMQTEDNVTTLEKENGDTLYYSANMIPASYSEGDIVTAIVYSEDKIEFLGLDVEEMERRRLAIQEKKAKLRDRIRNNA